MLANMFVGDPPGNYDRLLDVSRAVTGSLYFVPTPAFLEGVAPLARPAIADGGNPGAAANPFPSAPHGSLGIGSLKKEAGHE
jgi:putative iron-dependent peroxidase